MNVGSLLRYWAQVRPNHTAVVCGNRRFSFLEAQARAHALANALTALGLRKGDKLALILPNCLELLDAYRVAAQLGLVAVPLSPLLRGPGLLSLLRDSEAAAVICMRASVDALNEVRGALPDIVAGRYLLVDGDGEPGYTNRGRSSRRSPTTGRRRRKSATTIRITSSTAAARRGCPKGSSHTHYIRALYGMLFGRVLPVHAGERGHARRLAGVQRRVRDADAGVVARRTYVLQPNFDAEAYLAAVERERVTHVMLVPSQIVALLAVTGLHRGDARGRSEMFCSVGAPLLREHKDRLRRLLPERCYELYGLTEGFVTVLDATDFARKMDSVGVPPPFMDMRIVDDDGHDLPAGEVGEIVGRGPLLMPGYYKRPDLTAQRSATDGCSRAIWAPPMRTVSCYLVDRKKDMIISGGVNVYPRDIEEVAVQHPAVREWRFSVCPTRNGEKHRSPP